MSFTFRSLQFELDMVGKKGKTEEIIGCVIATKD